MRAVCREDPHYAEDTLTAGDGPDDLKGLRSRRNRFGERCVWWLVGPILFAGEEPHERPALLGDMVADGPAQHRITGLERIEHRAERNLPLDLELNLCVRAYQRPQMGREHDSDHGRAWTSTESTAGRSRTMGAQLSPASADAYTCPPVVPK